MLRKFTADDVSSKNPLKNSVERKIKSRFVEQYPRSETIIDVLFSKKNPLTIAKCGNATNLLIVNGEPRFFQVHDSTWLPTLRVLHRYPTMMPRMQVDKGALKFILGGANIMCPGLTSRGGRMEDVEKDCPVQIIVEGKENACAIGMTQMSTKEILEKNAGVAIEVYHTLGDGLWKVEALEA